MSQEIIPNQWYAVTTQDALTDRRPLGLERLGLELVAWRDAEGHAVVGHAACPHRGANLALGRVENGCIECPYHGFRFDGDGACVEAPCEGPDAKLRRDMRVKRLPTHESHGLVWVWFGEQAPRGVPAWFDDFDVALPRVCHTTFQWESSLSRLVEGMMDMHHFPFAHRHLSMGMGSMLDPFEAREEGDTIITRGTLRHPDQPPERGMTMDFRVRFPATISVGLTDRLRGIVILCPVDETRTWGAIFYRQDYVQWPVIGRMVTWLTLQAEMKFVQPDDERMLLSSEPVNSDPRVNCYVRADTGIAMWHRKKARVLAGKSAHTSAAAEPEATAIQVTSGV